MTDDGYAEERRRANQVVEELRGALPGFIDKQRLPVVSVLVDGSLVRGDWLPGASDIDLSITFNEEPDRRPDAENSLQPFLSQWATRLPKRPVGRKPLSFDVQWQDLAEVDETGRRAAWDWSVDDVLKGYPKLWLYAFDIRRHHDVLFGEDVTERYTRLPPSTFAGLRLERIRRAALRLGDGVSEYDRAHGTITQMKNAWEAVRAVHLALGGESIVKPEILTALTRIPLDMPFRNTLEDMRNFYLGGLPGFPRGMEERSFRGALHAFTLALIDRFTEKGAS